MISGITASIMGIKFLKEQGYPELARQLDQGSCINSIFASAVRSLGKSKLLALYDRLPRKLKIYVLVVLEGYNDQRLEKGLRKLYDEFHLVMDARRPERSERFPECIEKIEQALLKYLTRRR